VALIALLDALDGEADDEDDLVDECDGAAEEEGRSW
jgi:hypothetical protein